VITLALWVGPLLAALLVTLIGIRPTLLVAAVPGLFAAAAITVAARQAGRAVASPAGRRRFGINVSALHRHGLLRALLPAALFECGNVATTLLILRATDLLHADGRDLTAATSLAIVIYAAHNAVAAIASLVGGALIDRWGSRAIFAIGAGIYVFAYVGFALGSTAWPALLVAFCLAGAGIGLAEPAESTLVAQALPDHLRGSGFGLLGLVQAGGDLLASGVVGLLWAVVSPTVGFAYAATWMLASLVVAVVAGRRDHSGN
jgi:MFS family permease